MNHVELFVDNLKCEGCGSTITKMLNSMKGVDNSKITVDESKVEFDLKDNLELDQIKKSLANLGYPEMGTTNTLQKAKSYISCAKGRWG